MSCMMVPRLRSETRLPHEKNGNSQQFSTGKRKNSEQILCKTGTNLVKLSNTGLNLVKPSTLI